MSRRTSIIKALVEKLKLLDGSNYDSNIFGNAYPKLKFWDEVNDFPSIYMSPGSEQREYMPGGFTWGYLGISLKIYTKGDTAQDKLEQLLEDIESVIDANRVLVYDDTNNYETTEILIASITTDEGLLTPFAVGEINLQVRYVVM
ncbi:hypothetical protein UFOVP961_124 [uncultured Caudovirales phage]|uniref:Uncharacterized protein n=1 Tax=uncultured Caudovirales phage TaxID=2100421 RepID=A0A6J5QS14_9CAUD|nr:hypothetical protein UFOVP961_124 [uncultured Caudovirales phage]CAB4185326.1 hypothetical protein UFOVP1123_52 [uncultured Caudovirales phage]CAB4193524.1 hypothetical protein UFOVP1239_98 [uncultured Caudovirales phage]CAB4215997.1 hypothetical protein UFOVP1484_56 [uncultured Caudovirales phage]CAB5230696.1 hypothetical protein UFOVP1577_62 [uncultured Caudovirales phage]